MAHFVYVSSQSCHFFSFLNHTLKYCSFFRVKSFLCFVYNLKVFFVYRGKGAGLLFLREVLDAWKTKAHKLMGLWFGLSDQAQTCPSVSVAVIWQVGPGCHSSRSRQIWARRRSANPSPPLAGGNRHPSLTKAAAEEEEEEEEGGGIPHAPRPPRPPSRRRRPSPSPAAMGCRVGDGQRWAAEAGAVAGPRRRAAAAAGWEEARVQGGAGAQGGGRRGGGGVLGVDARIPQLPILLPEVRHRRRHRRRCRRRRRQRRRRMRQNHRWSIAPISSYSIHGCLFWISFTLTLQPSCCAAETPQPIKNNGHGSSEVEINPWLRSSSRIPNRIHPEFNMQLSKSAPEASRWVRFRGLALAAWCSLFSRHSRRSAASAPSHPPPPPPPAKSHQRFDAAAPAERSVLLWMDRHLSFSACEPWLIDPHMMMVLCIICCVSFFFLIFGCCL